IVIGRTVADNRLSGRQHELMQDIRDDCRRLVGTNANRVPNRRFEAQTIQIDNLNLITQLPADVAKWRFANLQQPVESLGIAGREINSLRALSILYRHPGGGEWLAIDAFDSDIDGRSFRDGELPGRR